MEIVIVRYRKKPWKHKARTGKQFWGYRGSFLELSLQCEDGVKAEISIPRRDNFMCKDVYMM